jgi:membrane associated rhomboid family serine protease
MSMDQYSPTGFRRLPPVIKNLLIINGIFFLATIGLENANIIDLNQIFGMHYFTSPLFKPYQLVTYMFIHAKTPWHIIFNMFALWMFGCVLENVWGSKKFLIYYFVTGIGAILIQMLVAYFSIMHIQHYIDLFMTYPSPNFFNQIVHSNFLGSLDLESQNKVLSFINDYSKDPQNISLIFQANNILNQLMKLYVDTPVIGASGAVFGILLAFGMLFPNTLLYIYGLIPLKAKWAVLIFGALELGLGVYNANGDNVAHFAHLGGMLFGIILILIWKRQYKKKQFHGQL